MTKQFSKLVVTQYSPSIEQATCVVLENLRPPKEGEILVKNCYAGVNATDMNIICGRSKIFSTDDLPFDFGLEGLGTIEAIGPNVDAERFKVGQHGLVFPNTPKAYAEYLYIEPKEFFPLDKLDPHYLPLMNCGLTAAIGLDKSGQIKKGDTVLITSAAGGTGQICVQWAKLQGCRVLALCSTPAKVEYLTSLGCDRVINYKEENVDQVLSQEFPSGIDVIWETIGGQMFELLFNHLAVGGRIVIVGAITGYKTVGFPEINIPGLPVKLLNKSCAIVGFRFRHFHHLFDEYLAKLVQLYDEGVLKVQLARRPGGNLFTGIRSIVDAFNHLQAGQNVGKVIVQL